MSAGFSGAQLGRRPQVVGAMASRAARYCRQLKASPTRRRDRYSVRNLSRPTRRRSLGLWEAHLVSGSHRSRAWLAFAVCKVSHRGPLRQNNTPSAAEDRSPRFRSRSLGGPRCKPSSVNLGEKPCKPQTRSDTAHWVANNQPERSHCSQWLAVEATGLLPPRRRLENAAPRVYAEFVHGPERESVSPGTGIYFPRGPCGSLWFVRPYEHILCTGFLA